ncbi:PRRT1-like protein [Mya arenaria]|uniref:PRRT1-like protein n=1 Tax=Mya arenaria TaxID=6604 RepID=A0ABY7DA60_MYAAR|nr:proline-rich transmembrane protein 2-like [Mya arenaria]WAQ94544.1 PRRT1-like protein [Mya arenaria]
MDDKGEAPPPYSPPTSGNYGLQNPAANASYPGQTNYGYDQPQGHYNGSPQGQYAGYAHGSQGQFVNSSSMSNSNVVVAQVGGGPIYQTSPQDYTTQAWIACLCCFWPTGLLAIMKASESRDALARGDLIGAQSASNSARQFVRISYVVGIVSVVFIVVFVGIYVGVIMSSFDDYDDTD